MQGGVLCAALPAFAQTPSATMNYIETREPRTQISTQTALNTKSPIADSVMTTIQYLDGLGRPIQTVQYQGSPLKKDIVQPVAYDTYGREMTKYLPYTATTNDGSYKTDALTTGVGVFNFYKPSGVTTAQQTNGIVVTADPFSVTGFEPSPLNRVVEQGAPGENFQLTPGTGDANSANHTSKVVYMTNDAVIFVPGTITNNPGDHEVALYAAMINTDNSRTLARTNNNTYYGAGQLELAITKNENWKPGDGCIGVTEEYKDKEGHVVCRRTYDKATSTTLEELSTYYVYDDLGNLCFVLPPGTQPDANVAITSANLDGYCYQYRYDYRNRLTQKKLPGKGWEFTVYNQLDQVVMTQTGNQRNRTPQQWTFNKYDKFGRVILIGLYNYPGSTTDNNVDAPNQAELLALTSTFATPNFPLWEAAIGTTTSGYDGLSYPTGQGYVFLTINYYDGYANIPSLPSNFSYAATYSQMTTGLLTATKTNVLNSTDALWAVNYYNDLGLPIRNFKQHYLGGTSALSVHNFDDIVTTYNFNKQPTSVMRTHYDNISNLTTLVLTTYDTYQYDAMGRKTNDYNKLRDHSNAWQAQILLSQNVYNEIGQLRTKGLNAPSPYSALLQSVDYRYTPRGWLSSINNANLNMTDATTNTTTGKADLFGEELSYDAPPTGFPQYNGNISYVKWKSGTPAGQPAQSQQAYDYRYDALNRIINAMSSTAGTRNNLYNEYIKYNRMSDIISLGRWDQSLTTGLPVQIDSLTYTDIYYRVQKIDNTATAQPCDACFIDGASLSVEYQYDIDGDMSQDKNKSIASITYNLMHQPQTITFNNGNTAVYIYDANGNKLRKVSTIGSTVTTTEYVDGMEYDNGVLAFTQTGEGRARWTGTTYTYEYDLTDHLGNTRVTFKDDGTGNPAAFQLNGYYPFGATIGSLSLSTGTKNHYLYNHKEQQDETMLYDYGARFYDPVIGRWTSVDPLGENMRRYSTYNYGFDNPVNNTDPDGMQPVNGSLDVISSVDVNNGGKVIKVNQDGDPGVYMDINGKRILIGYMDPNVAYHPGQSYSHYGKQDYYQVHPIVYLYGFIPIYSKNDPNPDQNNGVKEADEAMASTFLMTITDGFGELFEGGSTLKALGLGSTGRAVALTLEEKLAMEEITSNPKMGEEVMKNLADSRWSGWSKMQYVKRLSDGKKIVIHYVAKFVDGTMTAVDDFKFSSK